jgi:type IV secretory pathway VirB10-like protein
MSMKRLGSGLLALSFLGMLLAPSVALAQAYRWVDEQGKVHYSEGLDSVPSQYRATATPLEFPKAPPPPPPAPEKTEGEKKPAEQPGESEKPKE